MFGHLNSTKFPKLLSKRIRKRYYKTLGTSVTNSPMFPPSMGILSSCAEQEPTYSKAGQLTSQSFSILGVGDGEHKRVDH